MNKKIVKDITIEQIIEVCCYISLPLLSLIVATLVMSFCLSGEINSNINNVSSCGIMFLNFSFPMIVILGVIPTFILIISKKCTGRELGFIITKKSTYLILIICIGVITVCAVCLERQSLEISLTMIIIHFLCVAISEEIMLRSILYYLTKKMFGCILNCIVNGLIFAFIYHSNEEFLPNLIIRFPLGFLLAYVRFRQDDVYASVGIHWMYNILISTI